MARTVSAAAWASTLRVPERDVPAVLGALVRALHGIDERVIWVRNVVRSGPDPDLDAALLVMERALQEATAQVEDARRELVRHA